MRCLSLGETLIGTQDTGQRDSAHLAPHMVRYLTLNFALAAPEFISLGSQDLSFLNCGSLQPPGQATPTRGLPVKTESPRPAL